MEANETGNYGAEATAARGDNKALRGFDTIRSRLAEAGWPMRIGVEAPAGSPQCKNDSQRQAYRLKAPSRMAATTD